MSVLIVCSQSLATVTCASCGMLFAWPEPMDKEHRDSHAEFRCPKGHTNYYPGKSEAEKLKDQVARLQTDVEYQTARKIDAQREALHFRKSRDGMKGALVKTQVRVKHGVCPCCKRTFSALADHMKTKHPDYACEKVSAPQPVTAHHE